MARCCCLKVFLVRQEMEEVGVDLLVDVSLGSRRQPAMESV